MLFPRLSHVLKEVNDLKIALVCTEKLPVPPVAGGAVQLYIDGILPYLTKQNDITVFCIQHPSLPNEEVRDNIVYIRVPAPSKASYLKNVKDRLSNNFDMVFVFNRPLWVLPLSRELPGVRFGLSLHNEMFHPEKINDQQGSECISRVEAINTVSSFIAKGVAARFPEAESKLNVIYSGVDTDKYHPVWTPEGLKNKALIKEKLGISNHKVILFVGRLSNKKGVDVLIKAMQKVMKTHKDTALAVIGSKWFGKNESDDYTLSLERLASSLNGPVAFTGFLPPSEIPPYYDTGDIFICPSQWNEPLARVHYEAMAAGLPIITTNRGGNAEVLIRGENGLVLDDFDNVRNCRNPDYMAEHIAYLLDNPALAWEMGKKGRKLAEEKYNWKRVADDFQKSMSGKTSFMNQGASAVTKPAAKPGILEESRSITANPDGDFFTFDF